MRYTAQFRFRKNPPLPPPPPATGGWRAVLFHGRWRCASCRAAGTVGGGESSRAARAAPRDRLRARPRYRSAALEGEVVDMPMDVLNSSVG